jgi:hypothetical protein
VRVLGQDGHRVGAAVYDVTGDRCKSIRMSTIGSALVSRCGFVREEGSRGGYSKIPNAFEMRRLGDGLVTKCGKAPRCSRRFFSERKRSAMVGYRPIPRSVGFRAWAAPAPCHKRCSQDRLRLESLRKSRCTWFWIRVSAMGNCGIAQYG